MAAGTIFDLTKNLFGKLNHVELHLKNVLCKIQSSIWSSQRGLQIYFEIKRSGKEWNYLNYSLDLPKTDSVNLGKAFGCTFPHL